MKTWRIPFLALFLGLALAAPQPAAFAADEGKEDEVDEWSNKQKEESEGILDRIRKLMDSVTGRLAEFDVGGGTQEEQRKIVEQIDDVIRKAQQMQQSQCSSSEQDQQQKEKERQERDKQRQEKKKSKGDMEKERREEQKRQMAKPQDDQKSGDENQEQKVVEKRQQEAGGPLPEGQARPGEAWGNLPERLRDDAMDARSRDFPERYRELIERFYKRLAD